MYGIAHAATNRGIWEWWERETDEFKYQLSIELWARENLCYLCYKDSDWSFTGCIDTNEPDDLGLFTGEHIEQECKYLPAVLHLENQD
jgi:hypothetical protein